MAYIDVKTVVWQRMNISDSSKVDAIKKHLESGKLPNDLFYEDDVADVLRADTELFNDAHERIWANGIEEV